jgi:hypothetical protein
VVRIGAIAWLAKVALHEHEIPDPDPARARQIAILRRHEKVQDPDKPARLAVEPTIPTARPASTLDGEERAA